MIGVYREFEGCMRLLGHVLRRLPVLALPPVAESLTRQIYFTGASATAGIVLRGAFIGTFIIAYVIDVLDADAALAIKILVWVVLREVGPLIAAVLVIQRSGTAVTTELALMQISGEVANLRHMRIDPRGLSGRTAGAGNQRYPPRRSLSSSGDRRRRQDSAPARSASTLR
jgi:phospholipid/cholesterol/gamma-HCH transport system permease protein